MAASVWTTSTGNSVTMGTEQGRDQHHSTELEPTPALSATPARTILPGGIEAVLLHGDSGVGLRPRTALRRFFCTLKQRDVSTTHRPGEHEPPCLPTYPGAPRLTRDRSSSRGPGYARPHGTWKASWQSWVIHSSRCSAAST